MRVALIGKTYMLRQNRGKFEALGPDASLTFIVPAVVKHLLRGEYHVEPEGPFPVMSIPTRFSERLTPFHFQFFSLWRALRQARPDLVQIDQEPPTLAFLQISLLSLVLRYKIIFFTWENRVERFPLPFNWIKRFNFWCSSGAIAGNAEAKALLNRHQYSKPIAVLPQLGVDEAQFRPKGVKRLRSELGLNTFTYGFIGRLVQEKGLHDLFKALKTVTGDWHLLMVGRGPLKTELETLSDRLGFSDRVVWVDAVAHEEVPAYLQMLDVLVLPSRTTPTWTEQFGHILIEAMGCGVATVGSNSGAIPEVIDSAGLIFPEGDVDALQHHLQRLLENPEEAVKWGQLGRERVLTTYTNAQLGRQTAAFWNQIMQADTHG